MKRKEIITYIVISLLLPCNIIIDIISNNDLLNEMFDYLLFCIWIIIVIFIILRLRNKNKFLSKKNENFRRIEKLTGKYYYKIRSSLKSFSDKNFIIEKALNNINVNIYVIDNTGRIVSINNELLKNLNINEKDVLGKNYRELGFIEYEKIELILESDKCRNISYNNIEDSIIINNDTIKVLKSIHAICDENHKLQEIVVSFVDINKLKNLEDKIMSINHQLTNDLKMAKRVQEKIIPDSRKFSTIKELNIGYSYSPMDIMGGDLYDIININEGVYAFFIADVSGHGASAALITAMIKMSFLTHANKDSSPERVLSLVNEDIFSIIGNTGYFVSVCYCILDTNTGEMNLSNGGHMPTLIFRNDTRTIEEHKANSTLLGVFESKTAKYSTIKFKLNKGDKILLFTDGLIESQNEEGEFYGKKRLIYFAEENQSLPVQNFVNRLTEDVKGFTRKSIQTDDIAIIFIEYI